MNLIRFWQLIFLPQSKSTTADQKPSVKEVFFVYIVPLSLITPVMLSYVAKHYPKLFLDKLPTDRLYLVGLAIYVMQMISVPIMALILKNLGAMVNIKPTFRDSFLIISYAVVPAFIIPVFYVLPNFTINLVMHGIAALAGCLIIYKGIKNIFGLERRGARFMLTMATVATAATGFGVVLVSTLIFWGKA